MQCFQFHLVQLFINHMLVITKSNTEYGKLGFGVYKEILPCVYTVLTLKFPRLAFCV